jgi:RND family efflux transporter MFP subunit
MTVEARDPAMAGAHGGGAPVAHGEGELFDPTEHRPTKGRIVGVASAVGLTLLALLAVGIVPRLIRRSSETADQRQAAAQLPRVRVARAVRAEASAGLTLPGSIEPLQETNVYARANGYVQRWLVDIGAKVQKDDLLVVLDIPDIDEELGQARASANQSKAGIAQAQAQLELAQATDRRYQALRPSGVVSQQEVDQTHATRDAQLASLLAAQAAFGSAQANVRRLVDLKSFGRIVAPFSGIVTLRSAEVGQLVTSGMTGQPLFKVAEVDVVRVFVDVPQLYASAIRVGMDAPTAVREMPGRVFPGHVARTAGELDMSTRTLRTEVDLPNGDGALIAGMYARVSFDVARTDQPLIVPSTAVLFDSRGTRVATVRDGSIRWTRVDVAADFGDRLAIGTGIADTDVVVVTPSEQLVEGMRVRSEEVPPAAATTPAAAVRPSGEPPSTARGADRP